MVHLGQKYRKVGEDGVWEIYGLGNKGEWFLDKIGTGAVETVHERDLESGSFWTPVPGDTIPATTART